MSTVLFIAMLTGLNTRMSKAKQTVKMDMMQEFRGEEKNAVPTSIRNPRIFWSPTLHCGAASRVHCTLYLALSVRRRWQRIIHSPQSQDLDSQTQTGGEHCQSSLRQMRYSKDSDLLVPCLTLRNRWFSKGCRSGRESSRLLDRGAIRNVNASFKIH